jgi:hypothetical protein
VTKVQEHAVVPVIDRSRRLALARAFDRPGVVAASLFGSQASGTAGALSDVDLAVWLEPRRSRHQRARLARDLRATVAETLATDEVDLAVLNDASPLLRHRAIRDGVRLVERDRDARVRLEARALLDYLDTVPLRATLAAGVERRLAEGRFGRR